MHPFKVVLLQLAWALFVFWKLLDTMSPDHLMMRKDPSTFEVMDLHEYFQDFTDFIGIEIAIGSFFPGWLEKTSQ